ncbi:MAG: 2-dehydropantoate 2-reductase [Bacteroidetes bacterium]|nr:2-dehydropantoate 2-reductase [Bacteroidota bacterium]
MQKKYKIIIAGIGAVGGYYGGKLAKAFFNSENTEIIFYARGENLEAIRSDGLTLQTAEGIFTAHPALATDNASEAGIADLIICCTKSYHLEDVIEQLKPCIDYNTVILPLLNGVDAPERLKKIIPGTEIWTGCVYIVSRLIRPGVVEQKGTINSLHFGAADGTKKKLEHVLQLFPAAGINASLHENITEIVWQKYVFISSIGSATTYLNASTGAILGNDEHKKLFLSLLSEITQVAKAKQIILPTDLTESTLKKMASLPYETTSSMQVDYVAGKQTEAEILTAYVVRLGKELNVPTPAYELIAGKLIS